MKVNSVVLKASSGLAKVGCFLTFIYGVGLVDAVIWVPFFACFTVTHVMAKHVIGHRLDPVWKQAAWKYLKAISRAEAEIAHRWPS